MKRVFICLLFVCLLAAGGCCTPRQEAKVPKYIILFIGDGMSMPQRFAAEEFSRQMGYGKLAMNHFPNHAPTRSVSANSLTTDSAASGTAIACGSKTSNGRIGVDAKGKRLESVAELAKKKGYKVGIVSTMVINHATPAAFYGHRTSRNQYYELGIDLIDSNFDYFAGGAIKNSSNVFKGQKQDLFALARKKGYKTIDAKKDFMALKPGCGKVIFSASPGYMPADMETPATGVTLTDLTVKGLELLKNPKGFFLMVEGGCIDYYGHGNDAAGNIRETLALDKAVKAAVDFMKKHPEDTIIVITGDHETGGMTMGVAGGRFNPAALNGQKVTYKTFANMVKQARAQNKKMTFEDAKKLVTANFGLKFSGDAKKDPMVLNAAQIKALEDGFKKKRLWSAVRVVMAQKAGIGWTTSSHTGVPVLTTAAGVQSQLFSGYIENTEISSKLKSLIR